MNRIEQAIQTIEGIGIKEAGAKASVLLEAATALRDILASRTPKTDYTKVAHREVLEHIRQGRKINAIKLQRELTTMGLAEAKNFVETNPACLAAADEFRRNGV